MLQRRLRNAGPGPVSAQAATRARQIKRASGRARITIPLLQAAAADKEAQRKLERAERAQERAGAAAFDGDPRLTLYVVDRIIWLAHWMDQVSMNQLPPKGKRSRADIDAALRAEFPDDLIALAWTRLARRDAPVLEKVA